MTLTLETGYIKKKLKRLKRRAVTYFFQLDINGYR